METEQEQISRDFKHVFGSPQGLRVLKKLEIMCLAFPQAPLFKANSQRETDFNLGMNWVFGYIKNQINLDLNDNQIKDCQTEEKLKPER